MPLGRDGGGGKNTGIALVELGGGGIYFVYCFKSDKFFEPLFKGSVFIFLESYPSTYFNYLSGYLSSSLERSSSG